MSNRRVVVWRHGRTAWNAQRRFQGQLDIELDDVGRAQARRAARVLARLSPSAIVASDLVRARTTAQALADLTGLPVVTDKGFREIDVGAWQGHTLDEIAQTDPVGAAMWIEGREGRRGGGETLAEVADRARVALDRSLLSVDDGQVLVVATHGACGRSLIASLIGLPTELSKALGPLGNCSWSVLGEARAGWRLLEHNAGTLPEPPSGDDS